MPVLPADPLTLAGLGLVAATIAVLLLTDWPKAYVLGASAIVLFGVQFLHQWLAPGSLGLPGLALRADSLPGTWWTPVSYAFVHGSLFHLFGNLFILLTVGPALEESVGPRWFLGIYAAGGVAAAAVGILLAHTTDIVHPAANMVGSSGAIFAVLTTYAVRHPREKLPTILVFLVVWLPSMLVLLIFLALNIAYIFTDTNVAWYGHFAGFLAGLAIAELPLGLGEPSEAVERVRPDRYAHLVETAKGQEALEHLEGLEPGEEDVAAAWLDVLAEEATCPVCAEPAERDGYRLACPNGHDLELAGEDLGSGGAEPDPR